MTSGEDLHGVFTPAPGVSRRVGPWPNGPSPTRIALLDMRDPAYADFWHLSERFVFENQTTGQVLDWSYRIQFVTNADGEVKVDV